jgi:hypothetical protein
VSPEPIPQDRPKPTPEGTRLTVGESGKLLNNNGENLLHKVIGILRLRPPSP